MSARALPKVLAMALLAANLSLSAAEAPAQIKQIKVLPDKAPDCTSLKAIIETVTRGCKTNDEKGVAVYNFLQLTHYHAAYTSEPGGVGALNEINVYGWGLCGGLHTIQAALWRELGWEWRYVGWSNPGHTTTEAMYDGKWHYYDTFLKYYVWMPDANAPGGRTIAGEDDLKVNPGLVLDNYLLDKGRKVVYEKENQFEMLGEKANWQAPAFLVCGDDMPGVISGVKSSNKAGSPTGWAGYTFDSPNYSADVNLAPGYSLTLNWTAIEGAHWYGANDKRAKVPGHSCGDKDLRNSPAAGLVLEPYLPPPVNGGKRSYANGSLIFAPDFSSDAFLKGLTAQENIKLENGQLLPADNTKPASITFALQSPYVMTKATGQADGADTVELSIDGGKKFQAIKLAEFSEAVGGKYSCLVKVTFKEALKVLKVDVTVQHNRGAAPYLSPGKNVVAVSVADAKDLGENKLVVTYVYSTGFRTKSFEQLAEAQENIARGKGAQWSETPTAVQKVFTAKDLPATFEIDVPTPKNRHPVYPRMIALRREVLAPTSKPLPLPEGAAEPKAGPEDELQTLPNPFLIGLQKAPPKVVRPTVTKKYELVASHAVSSDGKAEPNHYIKTKDAEFWVVLVGGELKDLPAAKDIAAARLVFPVVKAIAKASTKAAATLLKAPFEKDKPIDFAALGDPVGTANLPKQPDTGDYNPPKEFSIEITRILKQIAAGEAKFNGFALRTMPDRAVDEGYTVRFDLPAAAKVTVELDVYADPK